MLALMLENPGGVEDLLVKKDHRKVREHAPAEHDLGGAGVGETDVADSREDDDLAAEQCCQSVVGVEVGEYDVIVVLFGLGLKGSDIVSAGIPPGESSVVVGIMLLARVPDAEAGGAGLRLGCDELSMEAARIAVLCKIGAEPGAYTFEVVVD
ncbi:MAG TPA: hypothetical protein ENJ18_04300, partial [Nannocystis exedens]|nr:hypothetical protein [Nannocystis exedens]